VLLGADGEPVDGEVIRLPDVFVTHFGGLWAKLDESGRSAIWEHNADAIADAKAASVWAEEFFARVQIVQPGTTEPATAAATYQGTDLIVPVTVPQVRGKASWSGWVANMKEALPRIGPAEFLPFLEANRRSLEAALIASRLQALRAIHARAGALGIPLPTWAPGLTEDKPGQAEKSANQLGSEERGTLYSGGEPAAGQSPQEGQQNVAQEQRAGLNAEIANAPVQERPAQEAKPDRDATWTSDIVEAVGNAETVGEVEMLGRYKSTQVVMERLKRERPELWEKVCKAFDDRRAVLQGENGDVASPGPQ
jgi:hypothetical protein